MPKTVYICEHCGRSYEKRMDARWCEIQHEHRDSFLINNERVLNELKYEGQNPCDYCGRSYFVYGIERNCECGKNCKNYNLFLIKE